MVVVKSGRSAVATGQSRLSFHQGEALIRLAGTYPTLLEVLLEKIQNSIDENATRIWIVVNQKSRHITVRDNGDGASCEKFEMALAQVGQTMKVTGKLGRFGLGLVSSLGKCKRFLFTSSVKEDPRGYLEWTFVTDDIRVQRDRVDIPMRSRLDLVYNVQQPRRGTTSVDWRTEVRIEEYTDDRVIGRITMDSLVDGILERYNTTLRRLGAVVSVRIRDHHGCEEYREVRAKEFRGIKLEEVRINDPDGGETLFRLYLSPKTAKGRQGKVLVGEIGDEYRMNFNVFARCASDWLHQEVSQVLMSGIFEGEILSERAKLHVNRKSFEKDAALVGFVACIEKWFASIGQNYFKEAQSSKKEMRWQELGLRSMRIIESLLTNPIFANLRQVIGTFQYGTVGKGHVPPDEEIVEGVESTTRKAAPGKKTNKKGAETKEGGERKNEDEHPKHIPFTVVGPGGKQRKIVRADSLGFAISYEEMPDSISLWELDTANGVLRINIRHPEFVKCDESSDSVLMRFQEHLVIQALTLYSMPPEWRECQRIVLDEMIPAYVYSLINGDKLTGRHPSGKKIVEQALAARDEAEEFVASPAS